GLLAGWLELDAEGRGLTVKEALDLLKPARADETPANYPTMRAVLAEIFDLQAGQLPKSRQLGDKLRVFAGRYAGGRAFVGEKAGGGVKRWKVAGAAPQGGSGESGGSVHATFHARNPEFLNREGAGTDPPDSPDPPSAPAA